MRNRIIGRKMNKEEVTDEVMKRRQELGNRRGRGKCIEKKTTKKGNRYEGEGEGESE